MNLLGTVIGSAVSVYRALCSAFRLVPQLAVLGSSRDPSGLVITAGTEDAKLRIFDAATGAELKSIPLPLPAIATPMTYTLDGRQYIVISDGGHGDGQGSLGDSLTALAIN